MRSSNLIPSRLRSWAFALAALVSVVAPTHRAAAQGYVIVVNDAGPSTLSKDDVSHIFLRKSTLLVPVDQEKDSRVRAAFSRIVLGRPLQAVVNYWQQQIFSGGEAPPAEKSGDAEVLAYVRANPKGIGYVSAGVDPGPGVHVLTIR